MRISDLHKRILAQKPNLLPNLVAYWNFNGNGTDSVSGVTPSLQTNVTFNNASILGTSVAVTANNAVLRYADRDDFSFTSATNDLAFSVSLWVFFSQLKNAFFISKRFQTIPEWQIIYNNGRFSFSKWDQGAFNNSSTVSSILNPFIINTWYHLVVTNKDSNVNNQNIYINGINASDIKVIGGTYTRMNNTTASLGLLNINDNTPTETFRHQGRLDEVAIWKNRELTPAEVTYLYNSGLGRTYPL
jgi:hypothetical protein